MKIDLQNATTVTWLFVVGILLIAVAYSVFAINQKPPQMAFTPVDDYTFPYKIDKKGYRTELGLTLKEISGITSLNLEQVMAVQDEKGTLFTVDINTGNIVSEMQFDKDRDYEDLCLVGDHIFILERDGDLYQIHLAEAGEAVKFETAFSYRNDTESLCYDAARNRLLIAPKEGAPDGSELPKNVNGVYAFDLISKRIDIEPVFTIAEKEIGRIIGNGGKPHVFKPSAIAVHPKTGHIYVLASVGKVLIVVEPVSNQIMHVQLLDPADFPQPEGMTFDGQGNLLISSEGVLSKNAFIARYGPKNQQ